jgi:pimeloyl-ACP methyl ester carboxylesterase
LLTMAAVMSLGPRAWHTVGREMAALGTAALSMPLRWVLPDERFDPSAPHPTPVVFAHGLLGDPTNFLVLRRFLAARGIRNFASFSYSPRLDYHRLARQLERTIEETCAASGSDDVDVVGHSLGGLAARVLTESGGRGRVRRLVTLGAPYYVTRFPHHELAIFAAADPLVAVPRADGPRGRCLVIPDCGHLGLLYHPTVLRAVAAYLRAPAERVLAKAA